MTSLPISILEGLTRVQNSVIVDEGQITGLVFDGYLALLSELLDQIESFFLEGSGLAESFGALDAWEAEERLAGEVEDEVATDVVHERAGVALEKTSTACGLSVYACTEANHVVKTYLSNDHSDLTSSAKRSGLIAAILLKTFAEEEMR